MHQALHLIVYCLSGNLVFKIKENKEKKLRCTKLYSTLIQMILVQIINMYRGRQERLQKEDSVK